MAKPKKPQAALTFHREKSHLHRLPFVQTGEPGQPIRHFVVPPVPGTKLKRWANENEVGKFLALSYIKHLRGYDGGGFQSLPSIVLDIVEHGADAGVVVGFFWELGGWLSWAAKAGGNGLDSLSEEAIEAELAKLMAKQGRRHA